MLFINLILLSNLESYKDLIIKNKKKVRNVNLFYC